MWYTHDNLLRWPSGITVVEEPAGDCQPFYHSGFEVLAFVSSSVLLPTKRPLKQSYATVYSCLLSFHVKEIVPP